MPKTISCPHAGCDYLFSKPVHLRRHLLSHSDEAVWRCPNCDQEFKRIDSFQRHKKRIHPDQPNLAAVKIRGGSGGDHGIKSDEDAEDQSDDLDVSIPGTGPKTLPPPRGRPSAASVGAHHLSAYDVTSKRSPSANANNSSAFSPGGASRPAGSSTTYYRSQHYHPYPRNDAGSHSNSSAHQHTSAGESVTMSHSPWPSQSNQSQMYDSSTSSTSAGTAPAASMSFYPNLYGAPISYNDYGSTSSSALHPSAAYGQAASADQAAPLSIASLTAPSPSWGSSSNSDTEGQNFFDDILQSILMDSISSFVPHEPMAAVDFQGMAGAGMSNDTFSFGEQNTQSIQAAQPMQAQQQAPQMQQPQQHQTQSQPQSTLPSQQHQQQQHPQQSQQQPSQTQEAPASGSSSHPVPQPLANIVPFATFTNSAHNSGRSTPGTPRLPPTNGGNMDDADEMTHSVEKVGDQAATNIGARTRDLVLHGVNIPKKPPRLTAASLFSAATRHTRSMLPLLPSYWLLDHRRLAAERPYVFISLLAIGTLWQPRADVKAYGAELWQLIFRSIWAGAVFYLDQPQLMREATAVMAFTHLYAFLCRDESIRRKSIHSTYTGSSLGREYAWRQGIWFLIGPWEESLQRLLGPNIQMALVELEVLARDQTTNKLSAEQKGLLERLHGAWKQWSDAEEVNRNMICHSITESHHSEFLSSYSQMRSMGRIACQALVPCADDVWDAKTAIEWIKLVLEHKTTRESNERSLLAGKKQLGPILDALFGIDAPSAATTRSNDRGSGKEDNEKAKQELERMLCFTVKEHFALQSLLEGLHLLWIARYTPPFRTGTSYAADFSPTQPSFAAGLESAFCIRGGVAYHKLNVLDAEMMMAALSRWMRLYHQSYLPNPVANSTGFSHPLGSGGSAQPGGENGKSKLGSKTPVTTLGPNNDRFQLHFRFHVIQLSALFNAHHVVHALISTCGEFIRLDNDTASDTHPHPNGAGRNPRSNVQTSIPLRCESCVDPDSCPYRNPRLQRWAAVHAGAVIGNFMSMPRLSTLTPTILEGLGQAFGILVILCRIQRSASQRRRPMCKCAPEIREASLELISDQCLHLDAERPSPGEREQEMASMKFDTVNECWLQHGTLEEGATLLGQPIQDWPFVLQDMGNELKGVAGTWQTAEEFLGTAQKMLNSFTFYVD